MTKTTAAPAPTCSACSGVLDPSVTVSRAGQRTTSILRCRSCGGLTAVMSRAEARDVFGLGLPMQANVSAPEALRFFDVTLVDLGRRDERVHGWFDVRTTRVVQEG